MGILSYPGDAKPSLALADRKVYKVHNMSISKSIIQTTYFHKHGPHFYRYLQIRSCCHPPTSWYDLFSSLELRRVAYLILTFFHFLFHLGVFLERGCTADLCINILLTCLGWIPGVIHAFYIILKY
jgi:uncharacterized membrane protein YqaE (UPF0057 family)